MRAEFNPLNVPASVAAGTAYGCANYTDKWIQVFGTFSASLDIEGTMNGSDWFKVATAITTPSAVQVAPTLMAIRVRTTAFTSGAPRAILGGLQTRTV